jgi:uncharacterized protein YbgA (DUF1722 family)
LNICFENFLHSRNKKQFAKTIVGSRPGACPMSAAKKRLNKFNVEFNQNWLALLQALWAGTRACLYILFSRSFFSII